MMRNSSLNELVPAAVSKYQLQLDWLTYKQQDLFLPVLGLEV
jgi:hypothetical protein